MRLDDDLDVRWTPPWWNPAGPLWLVSRAWLADVLDVAVCGLGLGGFGAFGTHVLRKLRHDFRFNAEHLLVPVVRRGGRRRGEREE